MRSKIRIKRIMYPKNTTKTQAGEFSIFSAELLEHLEGEYPILHKYFNTITFKGITPSITEGNEFIVIYDNKETNNFGTSYELITLTKEFDKNNKKEVKEFLELVCGKTIANELIKYDDAIGMLERKETDKLLEIKGIGEKKLAIIYKNMAEMMDYSKAYTRLMKYGLSKKMILKICKAYGSSESAIEKCENNPYDLVKKVSGISFVTADEIARKCNLPMYSESRIECAINFVLSENGQNGRSYLTSNQFLEVINNLITVDFDKLKKVINRLVKENKIILLGNGEISLPYYFNLEKSIATELKRIATAESKIEVPQNWRETVKQLEKEQGWEHTDEQWKGIESALFNNIAIITGQAGTGKSTVTNAMCYVLDKYDIRMTCLSAKASQRITEVTGRYASTIHKLLGLRKDKISPSDIQPLYADIVIIDESSMVSGELFLLLLTAIPNGAKLIILGDNGQLQAIGDCSVFNDLLKTNTDLLPITRLTKIHRQAQASAIITKSIDVRNQLPLYPKGFTGYSKLGELQDLELFIESKKDNLMSILLEQFFKNYEEIDNILEIQIITAMKNRGNLCTKNINSIIQELYNENKQREDRKEFVTSAGVLILENDKVINTKNNYHTVNIDDEECPIYNGNIGIVKEIKDDIIIVNFNGTLVKVKGKDRNALNLAYAITTHSSQGSQWERTICAFDTSMWILLNVEMLYTAMTRASKHCVVVAEDNAIKKAIKTVEQNTKQTYLNRFLQYI